MERQRLRSIYLLARDPEYLACLRTTVYKGLERLYSRYVPVRTLVLFPAMACIGSEKSKHFMADRTVTSPAILTVPAVVYMNSISCMDCLPTMSRASLVVLTVDHLHRWCKPLITRDKALLPQLVLALPIVYHDYQHPFSFATNLDQHAIHKWSHWRKAQFSTQSASWLRS